MNMNEQEEREAIARFISNFNNRLLLFQTTTFNETINNVLRCPITERGLLAIYLHDEKLAAADESTKKNEEEFSKRIGNVQIAEYLNENFILWNFDSNAEYMQQLLKENLINYDVKRPNSLPVLLIVGRFNGINEIINTITVNTQNIRQELETSYREYLRRNVAYTSYLDFIREVNLDEYNRLNRLVGQIDQNRENNSFRNRIGRLGLDFKGRYRRAMKNQMGTFKELVNRTIMCAIQDRKLIAIYLHNDNHVGGHDFVERILQARLADYLNGNFILWGFDCSSERNKQYMQILLNTNSIGFNLDNPNNLPSLLIVGRFNARNEIINTITVDTQDIRQELEDSNNEFERRNAENYNFLYTLERIEYLFIEI